MTVTNQTVKSGPYAGNGSTTTFPRTFKILVEEDIRVIQTVGGVSTDVTTGFTQTGVGADTGTVDFSVAPAVGAEITLLRNVTPDQQADFTTEGVVDPEVIETALDRVVMIAQDLIQTVTDQVFSALSPVLDAASNIAGAWTVSGSLSFNDDTDLFLGSSQNAFWRFDQATNRVLLSSDANVIFESVFDFTLRNKTTTERYIRCVNNNQVELYFNGNLRAATTADGLTVTGDVIVDAEAYGAGWSGSQEVPTKGDIYTKVETLASVQYYKSTIPTAGSAGGTITEEHGRGEAPSDAWAVAECNTADGSFEVGDRIHFRTTNNDGTGVLVTSDATNVNLTISNLGISVIQKDGTGEDILTPSRWDFTLYASVIS